MKSTSATHIIFNRYNYACISLVQCPPPINGLLNCPNGTITGAYRDTCTFSCKRGFELQGQASGTCLANQQWSGGNPICSASKSW